MSNPIRMCINCRNRFLQEDLFRFVCENKHIFPYKNKGRSFYICKKCINDVKLEKKLNGICKSKQNINTIKEIIDNEIKN